MIRFFILSSLFVIVIKPAISQNQISGYIIDDIEKFPVPGVVVKELGTNNSAVSNGDGYFLLQYEIDTSSLKFSSLGYLSDTIEHTTRDSVIIYLIQDIKGLEEIEIMPEVLYTPQIIIGYSGGFRYSPYGIHLGFFVTDLFKIPFYLILNSGIQGNFEGNLKYKLELYRINAFRINGIKLDLFGKFRKVDLLIYGNEFISEELLFALEPNKNNRRLSLGLGTQTLHDGEDYFSNFGVFAGLSIPMYKGIFASYKIYFWQEYWQHDVYLDKSFFGNDLHFRVGYENLRSYSEIYSSLTYRIRL